MKQMNLILLTIMMLLAACGGGEEDAIGELPTSADLPTLAAPTASATATVTPPLTATSPATTTPTVTTTASPTLTVTPSATITDTVTPTPTNSATPTNTPPPTEPPSAANDLIGLARNASPPPPDPNVWSPQPGAVIATQPPLAGGSTGNCNTLPAGGFATVYASDPTLAGQLGCPLGASASNTPSAVQNYERGQMVWLQGAPNVIYALYSDGRFERYNDTYVDGVDPVSGGETPPDGLIEPVRGFGKVWRTSGNVRGSLGWATTNEDGNTATVQEFERGRMVALPQRGDVLILIYDSGVPTAGSWRAAAGGP